MCFWSLTPFTIIYTRLVLCRIGYVLVTIGMWRSPVLSSSIKTSYWSTFQVSWPRPWPPKTKNPQMKQTKPKSTLEMDKQKQELGKGWEIGGKVFQNLNSCGIILIAIIYFFFCNGIKGQTNLEVPIFSKQWWQIIIIMNNNNNNNNQNNNVQPINTMPYLQGKHTSKHGRAQ